MKHLIPLGICSLFATIFLIPPHAPATEDTEHTQKQRLQQVAEYDRFGVQFENYSMRAPLTKFTHKSEAGFDATQSVKSQKSSRSLLDGANCPGTFVGDSWADMQTNGSMQDRLIFTSNDSEDFLHCFWMASLNSTDNALPDRGTYYRLLQPSIDGTFDILLGEWDDRLEGFRTGWASAFSVGASGAGVIAHDFNNFTQFNVEVAATVGDNWQNSRGPQAASVWPRTATDGKGHIHAIYTYNDEGPASKLSQIGYVRSEDNGATWSEEVFFTGNDAIDADIFEVVDGQGADSYAIDARDDVVVVAYVTDDLWLLTRKSTDNGITWGTPTLITRAQYEFDEGVEIIEELGANRVRYLTNSQDVPDPIALPVTPGTHMDVILDSRGIAHYVFGVVPSQLRGIGIWDPATGAIVEREADTVLTGFYANLGMLYWEEGTTTLFDMAPAGGVDGTDIFDGEIVVSRRFGSGRSRYPQLGIDENDNVYLVYSTPMRGDLTSVLIPDPADPDPTNPTLPPIQTNGYFGHLMATHMDVGRGWSDPVNLTPDGVDCIFPTMADRVLNGRMMIAYSADGTPGDRTTTVTIGDFATGVFSYWFATSSLNPSPPRPVSVRPIERPETATALQAFPNPADNDVTLRFTVNKSGATDITLYNSAGAKVATLYNGRINAGSFELSYNVGALPAGSYYLALDSGDKRITTPLTVVR